MLSADQIQNLQNVATAMVAPGKGLLAADESFPTIAKRFQTINLESTEANRRAYRELLFTTPDVSKFISGVILFDETIRQSTADGRPFVEVLQAQGILPGIKVDQGTENLPNSPQEKVTKGLDGLAGRLQEYVRLGAKFTKWRAVITILDSELPSAGCIQENAKRLAEYAAQAQAAGLVPIIEPEVLMDGSHTLKQCQNATLRTLQVVFQALQEKGVVLESLLLKPNMVISGEDCPVPASAQEIAQATLDTFQEAVPPVVPGIMFLSGGQTPEQATQNLNAINKFGAGAPWRLSFSYGRALQEPVLKIWQGKPEYVPAAQKAYFHRARLNSLASLGQYDPSMEAQADE